MLERVTEMLSVNIQSYWVTSIEGGDRILEPRWVELGEESELERQRRLQDMQRDAADEYYAMEDPVNEHIWSYHTMRNELLQCTMTQAVYGQEEIFNATREDLHSMFKLHFAMGLVATPPGYSEEEFFAFENWSAKLLRRCLCLARVEESDLLEQTPLPWLRTVCTVAFGMWEASSQDTEYPEEDGADSSNKADTSEAGETRDTPELGDQTHGKAQNENKPTIASETPSDAKLRVERALWMVQEEDDVNYDDYGDTAPDELDKDVCQAFLRGSGRYIRASWILLFPGMKLS